MPNVRDSVSIVRRIINRYRGSNTCNGQVQHGKVSTHTNIGISKIIGSVLFIDDRGINALKMNSSFQNYLFI
jgi:hypothetical protein